MTTPTPDDLLPCPFCGGQPLIEQLPKGSWDVGCDNDNCFTHCVFSTKDKAVEAWNTRTPPAQDEVDLAELEPAIDLIDGCCFPAYSHNIALNRVLKAAKAYAAQQKKGE